MARKTKNRFQVGERVVVPLRGVCELMAVQQEKILDSVQTFYELKPSGGKGRVKIPATQLEAQGVRATLTEDEMEELLTPEERNPKIPEGDSIERMKRWTTMLRSGERGVRKQVLLELQAIEKEGELNKEEQGLQRRVRRNLRDEVQVVLGLSASHAGRRINEALRS